MSTRQQLLADILITAAEGGINYWAHVSNYRWNQGPAQTGFTARDREDTAAAFNVTIETAELGIERIVTGECQVNTRITDSVKFLNTHNEPDSEFDAQVADAIIQAALFGELVYS